MSGINESATIQMSYYYTNKLDRRLLSPSRQSMLSIIRDIEAEYRSLRTLYSKTKKLELVEEIGERIELLKTCGLNSKIISSQKVVFFRETVHKIEEDLLMLIPPYALCAEAFKIKEQLKLANLPDNLKETWGRKLEELVKKLDCIDAEIGLHNMAKPEEHPDELYSRYEQPLMNIREVLRATLSLINRSIDNRFIELYMMKINNVFQVLFLPINLALLLILMAYANEPDSILKDHFEYIFYMSLGAFGGSISAIISEKKQSLIKGSFLVNFLLNVIARPVIGAAAAIALTLIAKSGILFTITNEPISGNGLSIVVAKPEIGFYVLALVAGFGGEKLLRSTMDRIIKRLSDESSKIKEPQKQDD